MHRAHIDTRALLHWIDECNNYTPEHFVDFVIKDTVVGAVHKDRLDHHACPSRHVSLDRGLDFMNRQVQLILFVLEHIDQYIEDTNAQENAGWWMQ